MAKTALLECCSECPPSPEEVQTILELYPKAISAVDEKDGKFALHKACWKGA